MVSTIVLRKSMMHVEPCCAMFAELDMTSCPVDNSIVAIINFNCFLSLWLGISHKRQEHIYLKAVRYYLVSNLTDNKIP